MNLSQPFIERPIATSLLMGAIALFGTVAYQQLAVSDLPNVDFPTLQVSAALPGASPDTMAASVATPLENQFSTIAGIESMTSINSLGSTQITLEFDLDRSMDGAAIDVQAAITQASRQLPAGMPTPPTFTKVNPADQPILYLVLTSKQVPLWTLDEFAETRIAQRISMVTGVAQVQVLGAQKYAVHVQMDPHALASHGVGINEVENALRAWNVNLPTGQITGPQRSFALQTSGQLTSADQYMSLVVAYRNGVPVRLQELGSLVDSVEDDKTASWFYKPGEEEQRAIVLAIQRQPGTNTIAVTDNVKNLLPVFENELPPSVHMDILYDRSQTIRESYEDVQLTMALTLLLVVGVIFLFLRNVSATVIPSLALPFSIVGTFAIMYMMDYSLDNLSMMALILSVGFVVDDAIVMLENIFRHMELGKKPLEASLVGSSEIGFTIVSMTLSLTAVFIPVLFMGGILGRLFREFSVTICVAILISGVVSVTLTPMLCSRFLRVKHGKHGVLYRATEAMFDWMLRVYDRTLQVVLRYRPATMFVFVAVLVGTIYIFEKIPKGFIPDQDTDQLAVITEAAQGTSFYRMSEYQRDVAEVVRQHPDVEAFTSSVGGTASSTLGGPNFGQLVVRLKPRAERERLVDDVILDLRPQLENLPGMKVYLQNPPTVRIGGQVTKSLYQLSLQSPDKDELYATAETLEELIAQVPGVVDVATNVAVTSPQINISIDRDKAAALQVNANQIENAFYDAYGPRWVSTIYGSSNQYKVLLELKPEFQANPDALSLLYFKAGNGNLIPLDTLASVRQEVGPQSVNHYGQLSAATVSFNLAPKASLGEVFEQIEAIAAENVPPGVSTAWQGAAKAFQGQLGNTWVLLLVAIFVVYIVLGILYESYIHPLTILSGLPSAGFGALMTLYLFGMDLNIYAFVGLIMLIGIVEKNAIMQIDFALDAERNQGLPPIKAIQEGCLIRFRPIMMTTMAALFGAVPIALGYGAGGEARQPLGLAVVGGLMFSQLITLYLTPVFYTYMAALQTWLGRKRVRQAEPVPVAGD